MTKQLKFDNFLGGLNLAEASTIDDNELAKAENCFYDHENRLTSRYGVNDIFNPISDTVTVIASMNTYDGDGTWTAGGDCNTVTTDTTTKKYDAGSVNFDVTVTGTSGTMSNTGITQVDLSAYKATGHFGVWFYMPVITDFTSLTLNIGQTLTTTDFELAVTTQADGSAFVVGWNFIKFDWASMTENGSPTGVIDEIRLTLTYATTFVSTTDFRLDGIAWYSGTYNKGSHSIYHVKTDAGSRITLGACGTNVFILENDNDWVLLADGYTDGEKFSFLNYKNVISFSNGTDNYSYYEPANESSAGSIVTEDAASPKAKYLMMVANTAYATGIAGALNEIKYTTALPANLLNTVWTNSEFIYDDNSREVITGFGKLPNDAISVFLENSAYYVDTVPSTTVIRPLDYDGGCQSFRTIQRVGNDMYFLAEDALYSLTQREATSGTFGGGSLSDKIQPKIVTGSDLSTANGFRGRNVRPNHYYLNLDTSKSGSPDSCMVFNTKLKAWTEYTNVAANQMTEYEDSSGNWHIIYANVFSGQVREIEKDFSDNGVEINTKIWTKENDFGNSTLYKEVRECDIAGFISPTAEINATDELDGENNATDIITGSNFSSDITSAPLGVSPSGIYALTGNPKTDSDIQLNLFNVRKNIYQACYRVQIKLESSSLYSQWVLSKIQFQVEALPIDFFPESDYI